MIQLLCENRIGVVGIDAQLTREVPADLVITQSGERYVGRLTGRLCESLSAAFGGIRRRRVYLFRAWIYAVKNCPIFSKSRLSTWYVTASLPNTSAFAIMVY